MPAPDNQSNLTVVLTALLYSIVAAAIVVPLYAPLIGYGFNYDDYHFVRPYSGQEIREVFRGPWDPAGIELPFYRPLTIVLYSTRFYFFGLNSAAYHALSIVMFVLAAVLFGFMVRAFFASTLGGVVAVVVFSAHPSMPYAAVAWITNQMHLLQLLVVLTGLLWWFAVRTKSLRWWFPLIGFEIAALMIKEDGVMLVPTIAVLHWLRRRLVEDESQPMPPLFLFTAVVVGATLLWFRSSVLHGIGGYALPGLGRAWSNASRGFISVFRLLPASRPWQVHASWFVTLAPLAALSIWRRLSPAVRFTAASGLAIGVLFDLPFVFVVKAEQMHVVAMGASLLLAGSLVGLYQAMRSRIPRMIVALLAGIGIFIAGAVTRHIVHDFEPFGKIVRTTDTLVTGWTAVPLELREYLKRKQQPAADRWLSPNPADALNVVTFGLHAAETTADGRRVRWMSGPVTELFVRSSAHSVAIPLRHQIGAFREAAQARIEVDGRLTETLRFSTADWQVPTVPLHPATVSRLRRMHRVVVRIDHAWVPSQIIRGSKDTRTLGLQLGELTLR